MNPHLQKQHDAFKKTMQRQPIIPRPEVVPPARMTPSPSPSTATNTNRPLNSYVHAIISYLKANERLVTFEELCERLNINLFNQPDILDKVLRNERIRFDGHHSLSFEAAFTVKNKEDIVALLKQRKNLTGIELAELKETNPRIEEMAIELVKQKEIFMIRAKEDGPKVLFYNDYKVTRAIDEEFKQLWMNIPVPGDEQELRLSIERVGMKPHSRGGGDSKSGNGIGTQDQNQQQEKKKKTTAKRPFRRIKITNDYLDNIDLNLDPNNM